MPAGLYVHVPFCVTKCPYCDFWSITDQRLAERFVDAVLLEARTQVRFPAFDTLYLGGGTPSALPSPALSRLLAGLLPSPGAEVTVEANPDDVTPDWLATIRAAGTNRLSLGVQALDDPTLRWLGRRHDAARAREAVHRARAAGFDDLSIDLMYALPGQDAGAWLRTLGEALALAPEHLSCYQLSVEPHTPFGQRPVTPADEEVQRSLFLLTHDHLTAAGYEHYEISNFARPGRRSRHNQKYWHHVPYLGLGPAAHSFLGRRRWWNVRSVERYVAQVERDGSGIEADEDLDDGQVRLEALYLGLRTKDGVAMGVVREHEGWESTVAALEAEGLATIVADRLVPSVAGFLVADALPARFGW
jgi:putative oxygen-independent coproporphyrinogen III oxidase